MTLFLRRWPESTSIWKSMALLVKRRTRKTDCVVHGWPAAAGDHSLHVLETGERGKADGLHGTAVCAVDNSYSPHQLNAAVAYQAGVDRTQVNDINDEACGYKLRTLHPLLGLCGPPLRGWITRYMLSVCRSVRLFRACPNMKIVFGAYLPGKCIDSRKIKTRMIPIPRRTFLRIQYDSENAQFSR